MYFAAKKTKVLWGGGKLLPGFQGRETAVDRRVILPQDLRVKSDCPWESNERWAWKSKPEEGTPKAIRDSDCGWRSTVGCRSPWTNEASGVCNNWKGFFFKMEKSTLLFKTLILTKQQKSTLICKAIWGDVHEEKNSLLERLTVLSNIYATVTVSQISPKLE